MKKQFFCLLTMFVVALAIMGGFGGSKAVDRVGNIQNYPKKPLMNGSYWAEELNDGSLTEESFAPLENDEFSAQESVPVDVNDISLAKALETEEDETNLNLSDLTDEELKGLAAELSSQEGAVIEAEEQSSMPEEQELSDEEFDQWLEENYGEGSEKIDATGAGIADVDLSILTDEELEDLAAGLSAEDSDNESVEQLSDEQLSDEELSDEEFEQWLRDNYGEDQEVTASNSINLDSLDSESIQSLSKEDLAALLDAELQQEK